MDGMDNFRIERHRSIMSIIHKHIDNKLLEKNRFYFGGGTLCSMKFGEYRESVDIDFLSCDSRGMANLKLNSDLITSLPLWQNREPKVDKDGVRMWCEYESTCFKLEFIYEARIRFLPPERFCDVLSLDSVSLMACKFLANSDRGYNMPEARKDIVDLLAIYSAKPSALKRAWNIAFDAYGSWLQRCTRISIDSSMFPETLESVGVDPKKRIAFQGYLERFKKNITPLLNERYHSSEMEL